MIKMLLGATGAGKSYHAVNHYLMNIVKTGRPVVTNLPLNMEVWEQRYPELVPLITVVSSAAAIKPIIPRGTKIEEYTQSSEPPSVKWGDDVDLVHDYETTPYLIIDEARNFLRKERLDDKLLWFFQMHRHFEFDILIISQNHTFIDPSVRKNVDVTYFALNMKALSLGGLGVDYKVRSYEGAEPTGKIERTDRYRYSKKGFELYHSRTMGGGTGENAEVIGAKTIWQRPLFRFTVIGIALLGVSLVWFNPLSSIAPDAQALAAPSAALPSLQLTPRASADIVLVGIHVSGGKVFYLISHSGRIARPVDAATMDRLGYRVTAAVGCAVWAKPKETSRPPRLIGCGDAFQ